MKIQIYDSLSFSQRALDRLKKCIELDAPKTVLLKEIEIAEKGIKLAQEVLDKSE